MSPLEGLLEEVRACRLCAAHLPRGPRPVLQISATARILIVGQAPGWRVHEKGRPFDDPSGVRLRQWLGIAEAEFYDPERVAVVPMGFCYPGSGKSGDLPPRPECAPAWRKKLLREIEQLELTVAMGQYALAWHFSDAKYKNLTELVKNWRDYWPQRLPLPHPSPRNNLWLRRNPWVEGEIIPELQQRVRQILD